MEPLVTLGISLGLGLLIGLQRERAESALGGIRTFPLVCVFGTFCGLLADKHGATVLATGFVSLLGVLAMSSYLRGRSEDPPEPGQTTEAAALVTFAIGAYLVEGDRATAIVAAGVTMVLLHLKAPMHQFVRRMGERDLRAVMQFVVISLIVLPLLPDRAFGPYQALNPFDIWRMVVLIVGLSLIGYTAYKLLGERTGTLLGGLIGGVISSTATTVSYARLTKNSGHGQGTAVFVIVAASTVAFLRVLIEIAAVAPGDFKRMAPPLTVMLVWMAALSLVAYTLQKDTKEKLAEPDNPAEIKSALAFGAIYAVVILAVAAARHHLGEAWLYGVALLSGLTDMDAITLSVSRMTEQGRVDAGQGWRLILAASLANLAFKLGAVAFVGSTRLAVKVAGFFAAGALGGLAIFWLWPEG